MGICVHIFKLHIDQGKALPSLWPLPGGMRALPFSYGLEVLESLIWLCHVNKTHLFRPSFIQGFFGCPYKAKLVEIIRCKRSEYAVKNIFR